jgi:hypothetical protein
MLHMDTVSLNTWEHTDHSRAGRSILFTGGVEAM